MEPELNERKYAIEKLVPSTRAYLLSFTALFLGGIAGTFIGYAMMEVFFPTTNTLTKAIGTLIICASIMYGINVIVSLGLQASVEWKARKTGPSKKRPSRLLRED